MAVIALCLTMGCDRDVLEPCWTCISFVSSSFSGTPTTTATPSPYTKENKVCDEQEKITAEKGKKVVVFTIGGTTLTETYQTVCTKKAKR